MSWRSRLEAILRRDPPAPLLTPMRSVFGDPDRETQRREAAMSLMDDEVVGYVLVRVVRDFTGPCGEVRVDAQVDEALWPPVARSLASLAIAADDRR